jgi:hypothetical protein
VITYLLAQAGALAVITLVAPLTLSGAVAALAVSGSTHAVIDRRWIVRAIVRAKGGCPGWELAPFWIDQALHYAAMLFAAVAAALVITPAAAAVVVACGAALIGVGLPAEQWRATAIAAPTDHL